RLAVEGKVEGRRAVGKYLFAVVDSAVFRILSPREGPGPRGQEDRFSHAARLASYQNAVVNGSAEHKAVVERIKSLTEAATRRLRERMAAERAAEFTAVVAELARATGDRVIVVKHWQ
ncbi:MAG: hypothetical protein K2Q09_03545, partial [Phycisphaerales bacterium]|nr:hypothetical protein [Phycisphaerales bacterium]